MLALRIAVLFPLIVFLESIEGNKKIFNVTCDDQLSSDGEAESYGSGNGSAVNNYCINDICSYSSDDLLKNIASDVVINIM